MRYELQWSAGLINYRRFEQDANLKVFIENMFPPRTITQSFKCALAILSFQKSRACIQHKDNHGTHVPVFFLKHMQCFNKKQRFFENDSQCWETFWEKVQDLDSHQQFNRNLVFHKTDTRYTDDWKTDKCTRNVTSSFLGRTIQSHQGTIQPILLFNPFRPSVYCNGLHIVLWSQPVTL